MNINEMNLHQKMLKIAEMADVLRKTKSGYGYKYVPEEDIQARVTAGLLKYHVMLYTYIVPGTLKVIPYHYEKLSKKKDEGLIPVNEVLVYADTVYKWVNADNPSEYIETPWVFVGQMEDASQAFGAGETYANRYYLMKQLQLATTEDDPDTYRSKQKEAENLDETNKQKEEKEALKKAIKEIVDLGSSLIAEGVSRDEIYKVISECNDGNNNPNSIKSIETCGVVVERLSKLKKSKGE